MPRLLFMFRLLYSFERRNKGLGRLRLPPVNYDNKFYILDSKETLMILDIWSSVLLSYIRKQKINGNIL